MTLLPLDPITVAPFAGMTFPRYQRLLASVGTPEHIAIGALGSDQPAGLVLAKHALAERLGTVLSLFVSAPHRRQGIASALLTSVESQLRDAGCLQVEIVYAKRDAADLPIECLLKAHGWSAPAPRMTLCKAGNAILTARFMRRRPLDPDFAIVPWRELTTADEAEILREQADRPWFPERLSPFQEREIQEPMNSLGLRHRGLVAGWMITHRVAADTVRYTSLFVRDELRGRGASMALVREATFLQLAALGPASFAMFGVLVDNPEMRRFVDRVMAPFLVDRFETVGRTKRLVPVSQPGHIA